jgi:hypothetical protein
VVSPERYRDDKGWRLLREHVREHAWLFVINQWDRGQAAQREDFIKLLGQGGFRNPLLFCTDCREDASQRKADDFAALEQAIQGMADGHLIEQLEHLTLQVRREALQAAIEHCLARFTGGVEDLQAAWPKLWEETTDDLARGLEWPMAEVARAFVQHDASPLQRSIKLNEPVKPKESQKPAPHSILWDDWAQMQLQDALDRLLVEADERRLPVAPLKTALAGVADNARKLVLEDAQRALRSSLAKPGNAVQRFLLKLMGALAVLLPLAAMGWVSWFAVTAYYDSVLHRTAFLGADFAANSALVVGLSWLLPFFLKLQLRPSTERAALRGLRQGVNVGLARLQAVVDDVLRAYVADAKAQAQEGEKLLVSAPRLPVVERGLLERMLPGGD